MKIAICDDDDIYRDQIKLFIKPYINENNIEILEFEDGKFFIEQIKNNGKFDIVFMDIEMNDVRGTEAVQVLRKLGYDTIVIFITNHVSYISQSFRLGAFQYLLKPITKHDFDVDMQRALSAYRKKNATFLIEWYASKHTVSCQDIIYIETHHRHLLIHTVKNNYECTGSLKDAYEKLMHFGFVRSHQGYLINMNHVASINKNDIVMSNNNVALLSRSERKNVMKSFNMYISGGCI